MSEPVEIEFLLKNRTKSGMAEVESGLDSVQQDASKTQAVIATLREEMQRLQQQVAAMPTLDQSNNIAMIEALQAKIGELESDLSRISKTAKSASASTKNTTLVPKDAAKAQSTFNGLNMSIQQVFLCLIGKSYRALIIDKFCDVFLKCAITHGTHLLSEGEVYTPQVLRHPSLYRSSHCSCFRGQEPLI